MGDEYSVLGKYVNSSTPIRMRHNRCGNEWDCRMNAFINGGSRCPKCASNALLTTEKFIRKIEELVGDEYLVLEEYKNSATPIKMRHNLCGHEWSVRPNSFVSLGSRCPKCAGKIQITTETFKERVYELVGDEYAVLGEYVKSTLPLLMRHNDCGHEWKIKPNSFISVGNRCPKCAITRRKKNV